MAVATPILADEQDCLKLPKDEQPFCLMMLSCSAIDDAERRKECFDGVIARYQGERTDSDVAQPPESQVQPTATAEPAQAVEPAPAVEPAQSVEPRETAEPVERDEPTEAQSAADAVERPWWRRVVRVPRLIRGRSDPPATPPQPETTAPAPTVGERSVERTVLDIPKRFTAEVTYVRKLVHDRQLVVLDDKLLFETERAAYSRLEAGDSVRVVRTSALFGERYSVAGTTGGAVKASRVQCERTDLGAENRRKCALLD
ncbi:MAG: hypothetical protein OXI79_12255 [Gammaproteobacteria bacterium]|nr:hypothetical protein [Gammaproteobacteria bacterium]